MTPTPTPDDLRPQHEDALARAVYVRSRAAVLRREVRDGTLPLTRVLALDPRIDPDDRAILARRPIDELLRCGRRIGQSGSSKILAVANVPGTKRLGTLTDRQRTLIADLVTRRAPWLADPDTTPTEDAA